jgi:hypothetical protein
MEGMDLVVVTGIGVALALAVVGTGIRMIVRGRREGRATEDPGDRMVASFRVAAGVRMLDKGLLLLVIVAVGAVALR